MPLTDELLRCQSTSLQRSERLLIDPSPRNSTKSFSHPCFETVLFAVATDLANAIVGFAEDMTIKARKIRGLPHELAGALSALRCGSARMRTQVASLGADRVDRACFNRRKSNALRCLGV
jgi:hypothetical protein